MDFRFLRNVIIKGLILFAISDLIFSSANPGMLGKITLYNHLTTGRQRFPFGEDSTHSYNLSLFSLDAMFASHVISGGRKKPDEYRVIILGDSSVWGTLLRPEETLAGQLNDAGLMHCGREFQAYNLGYPTISLTKDLMILDYALQYQPDLIIWLVSMEAFPLDTQIASPIVANNAANVIELIRKYNLSIDPNNPTLIHPTFWDKTLIGQRRALADLFRLQIYGLMWSATGIDQTYPADFQHAQTDFGTDITYHNMVPPNLDVNKLAFGLIQAGVRMAGKTPLILVNEPMLVSGGKNSDLRYNFLYPRWAYDQWREMMSVQARREGWNYYDYWNIIPANEFTNSAIHLTPTGEKMLAGRMEQTILTQSCP